MSNSCIHCISGRIQIGIGVVTPDFRHFGTTHDVRTVRISTRQVSTGELFMERDFAVWEPGSHAVRNLVVYGDRFMNVVLMRVWNIQSFKATHDVRTVRIGTRQVCTGELLVEGDFAVGEFGGHGLGYLGVCGDWVVVVMMVHVTIVAIVAMFVFVCKSNESNIHVPIRHDKKKNQDKLILRIFFLRKCTYKCFIA